MTSNISKFKTAVGDGIGNHIDALVPTVGYENKLDTYIPDVDRGGLYIIEKGSYISGDGEHNQSHENDCYYILAISSKEMTCQYKIDEKAISFRQHIDGIWTEWKNISNYPMSLVEGTKMEVEKGTFVQAKEGATIIGDLRERTFDENGVAQTGAVATGLYSLASGQGATASEDFSFAIGAQSIANGYSSGAIGGGNTAKGYGSVIVGLMNRALADYAYIVGQNNEITAKGGIAVGQNSNVTGEWGTAIGYGAEADGEFSVAIGQRAEALGISSASIGGVYNKALSRNAVVIGGNNNVAGSKGFKVLLQEAISSSGSSKTYDFPYFQHEGAGFGTCFISGDLREMGLEVGMKCTLTVGGVTATGVVIDAINYDSISITFSAVPQDFPSDAGGTLTVGEESPPKIVYTLDSVDGIEVGMAYSLVNPSGESKYNAGTITEIAEDKVTVDGDGSINAKGCFMAIIGHPELGTQDIGINSFAVGNGTIASSENQVVRGRFNEEDNTNQYADIVGNGTSDADRSNAYTLDWDGNSTFAGSVECTSIILKSPNGSRFSLSVGDNGELLIQSGSIVTEKETVSVSFENGIQRDFSGCSQVTVTNHSDSVYVSISNSDGSYMNYITPGEAVELKGDILASIFHINTDPDAGEAEITITKVKTV